jgi:DNA-binding response OmpR family regulator
MRELGGFDVVESEDGLEASEKLEPLAPDVMILDVLMPTLDAGSLCNQLRAGTALACLPIIMVSGKTQHKAVQEGLAAGANQYLCKPITVQELLQSVRSQLPAPAPLS